ncbi:MAG TPA: hypothetical protein PLR74_08080, partial [Agriterribacter sp.]|nr:hypothetical protein [Agriterribacter sp.]
MANRLRYSSLLSVFIIFAASCGTTKKTMDPAKKFPAGALRKDYILLREIMETFHPALYWYTSKDSMDYYFDQYYNAITDSMTRQQFGFT